MGDTSQSFTEEDLHLPNALGSKALLQSSWRERADVKEETLHSFHLTRRGATGWALPASCEALEQSSRATSHAAAAQFRLTSRGTRIPTRASLPRAGFRVRV